MRRVLPAFAALLLLPAAATAQRRPSSHPEVRLQAALASTDALHLLAGASIPLGTYVRLSAVAGGGAARADGAATLGSAQVEAIARFTLDPFRRARVGVSLGGGLAARHDASRGTTGRLVLVADLEGRRAGGVTPYLQLGMGGGVRIAAGLRGGSPDWR